jgi:hypothetical protein
LIEQFYKVAFENYLLHFLRRLNRWAWRTFVEVERILVSNELTPDGFEVFTCEFCGFGYRELETTEECEECCGAHGFASAEIRRKSIRTSKIELVPIV